MERNFECLKCGEKFTQNDYSMSVVAGKCIYKYNGAMLHCPNCQSIEIEYIEKKIEKYNVYFGKFASADDATKKRILRKRSEEHSNKKLRDRREFMDKNFKGSSKGMNLKDNS